MLQDVVRSRLPATARYTMGLIDMLVPFTAHLDLVIDALYSCWFVGAFPWPKSFKMFQGTPKCNMLGWSSSPVAVEPKAAGYRLISTAPWAPISFVWRPTALWRSASKGRILVVQLWGERQIEKVHTMCDQETLETALPHQHASIVVTTVVAIFSLIRSRPSRTEQDAAKPLRPKGCKHCFIDCYVSNYKHVNVTGCIWCYILMQSYVRI